MYAPSFFPKTQTLVALAASWLVVAGVLLPPAHAVPITETQVLAKIKRHATETGNARAEVNWRAVHALLFDGPGDAMSVTDLKAQVQRSKGKYWEATWNSVWEAYEAQQQTSVEVPAPPVETEQQTNDPKPDPNFVALTENVLIGADGVLRFSIWQRGFDHCVNGAQCTLPTSRNWRADLSNHSSGREEKIRYHLGGISGNDEWSVHRHGQSTIRADEGHWLRTIRINDRVTHEIIRSQYRWFVAARHDGGSDYRGFGYWMAYDMLPAVGGGSKWMASANSMSLETFAVGTNPAQDVSGVTGTATYRGEAAGYGEGTAWGDGGFKTAFFDQAPVALTADFDTMKLDGEVLFRHQIGNVNGTPTFAIAWQDMDGYYPDYQGVRNDWQRRLPERLVIEDLPISADGTFRHKSGQSSVAAYGVAGNAVRAVNQEWSHFEGRFYQPDGDNAPGSALGKFKVRSKPSGQRPPYFIEGAFGAEKQ